MKNRKLRVGIIGTGGISGLHFQGWQKLPDCEIVACYDLSPEAAKKRAEEFGVPDTYKTAQALLARKDIDVVDVCTPNRFHRKYAVAALNAGKHVLCEKPLALTPREVDAMIAAAKKRKRKLMCAQHQRFQASSEALKQYLTKPGIGEVYYTRAWYLRRRQLPTRPGFIYKKQSGGGPCIDVGVHILDLALYMMGNFEPVSVFGMSVTKLAKRRETWSEWDWGCFDKKGLDVEDFAAGMVRFADGAMLSLECSWMANIKPRGYQSIDLLGTKAGAKWPECEIYDHTDRDYMDTKIDVRDRGEEAHHAEVRHFAEAIMGGKPVPVPPEQSRAVMAILDGLYRSQKTGHEVRL